MRSGQRIRYLPNVGLTSYHEVMLNINKSPFVYIGGLKYGDLLSEHPV